MQPSQRSIEEKSTLLGSVRSGAVCGLVAAWAIFGLILAAGAQIGLPPQTFYQMVGVSLGLNEEWPAVYLGFILHMITGAVIGIIYKIISDRVRWLKTDYTPRAMGTGIATGVVVWAVLFVPLHFLVMQPTLHNLLSTSSAGSAMHSTAERLVQMSDSILYGALGIHLVFGAILGLIARISTTTSPTPKKLRKNIDRYEDIS